MKRRLSESSITRSFLNPKMNSPSFHQTCEFLSKGTAGNHFRVIFNSAQQCLVIQRNKNKPVIDNHQRFPRDLSYQRCLHCRNIARLNCDLSYQRCLHCTNIARLNCDLSYQRCLHCRNIARLNCDWPISLTLLQKYDVIASAVTTSFCLGYQICTLGWSNLKK